ncbi:hypothetical protein CVT26_002663 [Gymnopilus dilepis]|uniref:Uncharacterized protein n=1 Tax=Gymnopilus dilepis TaxID=231916 RepID=A0A409VF01_9AGAR|nr:hypothetical protein CVT26_002663 [Gymnopilus dilepis]
MSQAPARRPRALSGFQETSVVIDNDRESNQKSEEKDSSGNAERTPEQRMIPPKEAWRIKF